MKQLFNCMKFGHISTECRASKQHHSKAKQASGSHAGESSGVKQVQVYDYGSKSHCVKVTIGGVPMYGIIDSGAGHHYHGSDDCPEASYTHSRQEGLQEGGQSASHILSAKPFT